MKYDTIREATEAWVEGFNAIPISLIDRAYLDNIDAITEITPPTKGDRVYVHKNREYGTITNYDNETEIYTVEMDDKEDIEVQGEEFEVCRDDFLPMWGTMWMFGDSADDWWVEDGDGLRQMADCGFRIYEIEEGYIFGIDGAGYNFYGCHWIPLYKARGLQWHKTEQQIL